MNDSWLAHACLLLVAALAALSDLRTGHIPNWLTLPPLLLAPVAHALGGGTPALLASLFGALASGAAPALLFAVAREGMGGGDVKLFAALGALGGASLGIEIELLSLLSIAAYACLLLAFRGRLLAALGNSLRMFINLFLPTARRLYVAPEALTPLRLGGAILLASSCSLLLRHAELWT